MLGAFPRIIFIFQLNTEWADTLLEPGLKPVKMRIFV